MDLINKYISKCKKNCEHDLIFEKYYEPYISIIKTLAHDGILELIMPADDLEDRYKLFSNLTFLQYLIRQIDTKTIHFFGTRFPDI